ncbi:helix-turn-helix domain-containing protein [Curtobacterium pusillum]|uniref:helix-turn-helix domain-containing protein n=1 Tax=Curtobacterium pusillum TaxID=69373 RepID=UPI0021B62CB6|nr:helix-turn-helix domain-containing protein [Curtobacterium pusillum]
MAELARVSPRQLTRLFHDELQDSPAKYVELVRFELAKAYLDGGHSVTRAGELAGFGSSEALRRAFVLRLQMPPSAYQRRFATTGSTGG